MKIISSTSQPKSNNSRQPHSFQSLKNPSGERVWKNISVKAKIKKNLIKFRVLVSHQSPIKKITQFVFNNSRIKKFFKH